MSQTTRRFLWPKTAHAEGGKFAYKGDQETPNTLLASAEGTAIQRKPRPSAAGAVGPTVKTLKEKVLPYTRPLNIQVGNLIFGTEGWAVMSDDGVQIFKGENNEMIMDERAQGPGDSSDAHMANFLSACRSRNEKELHDPISNAYLSASLCHLANISYRAGRKLTLESGPKFTADPEATRMITRPKYREPYVV